ncbi:hypothetical protein E2L07_04575 [Halalkalibacterium halodurans]|nr:hypothetical protein E2L07_04575 [Halalkalibacterium halodurans]
MIHVYWAFGGRWGI